MIQQILQWLSWWVAIGLLGILAIPLAQRIFHRLPDRGYAFAKPLGLLVTSYSLWLGASMGLVRNSLGGALASVLILAGIAWMAGKGRWEAIRHWARGNRTSILITELVFTLGFALWAFVRSSNPEIQHTEKPMELAFLNSILTSDTFPPSDPWLSGYAISYYYFGYVMLALLTRLTGVLSGVAFNLGNALWFGMVAVGAYGLLFNLLSSGGRDRPWVSSTLGPAFVLIAGNLEGFLDVLHARHLLWRILPDGTVSSGFWRWLDIKQLADLPIGDPSWIPTRFLWWWRASRVINDVNLAEVEIEVIDEFPLFSFLLADNHPHLLALPFALMAIGFALQLFLHPSKGGIRLRSKPPSRRSILRTSKAVGAAILLVIVARALVWLLPPVSIDASEVLSVSEILGRSVRDLILAFAVAAGLGYLVLFGLGAVPSALGRGEILFSAWLIGALAFLNTWDSLIYLVLMLGVIFWTASRDPPWEVLTRVSATAVAVVLGAVLLHLPWLVSFSSQLSGILPNLIFPTRLPQFVVMFGVSYIPILAWLIWRAFSDWRSQERRTLLLVGLGLPLGLLVLSLALGLFIYFGFSADPQFGSWLSDLGIAGVSIQDGMQTLIAAIASRRLEHSWTALLLGFSLSIVFILLGRQRNARTGASADGGSHRAETWPFVALLVGVGAALVLFTEFFYLRDLFGTRMNTVFKFYFAAWILWGIAAAYAVIELWPSRDGGRQAFRALLILPLLLGFVYPVLALWTKTSGFSPSLGKTLDGTAYLDELSSADYEAIQWIRGRLDKGVIAEAIGGSYTEHARVSAHTGFPTVLGWDFHELQWRGSMEPQGSRSGDIQLLYETPDWSSALPIVERYDIAYIYVGPMEEDTYQPLNIRKFDQHLEKVYDNGAVRIYATPQGSTR